MDALTPTLYEWVGGEAALLRLFTEFYARVAKPVPGGIPGEPLDAELNLRQLIRPILYLSGIGSKANRLALSGEVTSLQGLMRSAKSNRSGFPGFRPNYCDQLRA